MKAHRYNKTNDDFTVTMDEDELDNFLAWFIVHRNILLNMPGSLTEVGQKKLDQLKLSIQQMENLKQHRAEALWG